MPAKNETSLNYNQDSLEKNDLHFVTETKFMHQYRAATAAHGGGSIITVKNAAGQIEIFTTATDGTVWNFYPDPAISTGFQAIPTGLSVPVGKDASPPVIAAGLNIMGFLVVFAVNNLDLNYVVGSPQAGTARWSKVQKADLSPPGDAKKISKILCYNIDRALYVGVLFRSFQSSQYFYPFDYAIWGTVATKFIRPNVVFNNTLCTWSNKTVNSVEFTGFDKIYWSYQVQNNKLVHHGALPEWPSFRYPFVLTNQIDSKFQNHYFTIMADGNIYEFSTANKNYGWLCRSSISEKYKDDFFLAVTSICDSKGAIHLFGLSKNNRLWHIAPSSEDTWLEPVPLHDEVVNLSACVNSSDAIELYFIGNQTNTPMTRMVRDDKTGDWWAEQIELPSSKDIEAHVVYATDVTVCNEKGTPQPNTAVTISASNLVKITVNDSIYNVGPTNLSVTVFTNHAGKIAVAQPTNSLGAATLSFSLSSQQPIGVRQFAGIQDRLAMITAEELIAAKDANEKPLLPDKYRNIDSAKALSQSFQACMKLVQSTAIKLDTTGLNSSARRLGIGSHDRDATEQLNRIIVPNQPLCWLIEFNEQTVVYRELTEKTAQDELNLMVSYTSVSSEGLSTSISELGDLVTALSNGIAKVTKALITAVNNKVSVTITFVIDGINYIIESAITFVEEVFDLVEVALANVEVTFEKTFEWLGFVFDWDDILRTHSIIAYTIEEFLTFLPMASSRMKKLMDDGITNLVQQIDPAFNELVEKLGNSNIGNSFRNNRKESPVFSYAISNNQILDAIMSGSTIAQLRIPVANLKEMSGPIDDLLNKIQDLTNSIVDNNEFLHAKEIFQNLGDNLDQILSGITAGLLRIIQGITKFMLQGVQTVVDCLIDSLSMLTEVLLRLLKAACNVPFVSSFYKWLTKEDLSPLSLIALIAAIPTTVLYKSIYKTAPFSDQASVDLFKSSYTRQALLTSFGLEPSLDIVAKQDFSAGFPQQLQKFMDIASATCNLNYGLLSIVPDAAAATNGSGGIATGAIAFSSILGFALELGGQGLSFPWLSSPGLPNCTSSDGVKKWLWLHGCAGIALDAYFIYEDATFPENNNTIFGPVITFIYGMGRTAVYSVAFPKLSYYGKISGGIECSIICLKILRLPILGRPPVLVALGAADFAASLAIGVTSFLDGASILEDVHGKALTLPGAVPWA